MYYNGKCVNTRDDYYISDWECPDGSYTYNDENRGKCYKDKKTTRPTYKCDDGFVCEGENTKLIGKECIIYDVIEAKHN